MDKKKTLVLSILGVLVLVIAVVGISYAMYTFTGTGTKENVITTGTISVTYTEATTVTLNNTYSSTDGVGTAREDEIGFSVNANISGGNTTIKYEVGFDVTEDSAEGGLKDEHINFNIKKGDIYLLGTTASTGIALSSRAASAGTLITSYLVDSGTVTTTTTINYVVKAWVNESYDLRTNGMTDSTGCVIDGTPDPQHTTESACTGASGVWTGVTHSNNTIPSTLTFKVKVVASA